MSKESDPSAFALEEALARIARLERRNAREKRAREEAESLLEQKSSALWKANQRLHEELENRADAIRERTREADEANRAKSEFLSTMTHEMRTPMVGVIGMTNMLLETDLSDKQRSYANTVRLSSQALLDLINDILDFSKIEARQFELHTSTFTLGLLVEDVLEILGQSALDKGLDLNLYLPPAAYGQFRGDASRIRQILLNLVGNAVKFTGSGSVSVLGAITQSDTGPVQLELTVKDTGIGIKKEAQSRLFNAFSQADTSMSRRYGGTGLGLAISLNLAKMMGGSLSFTSQEGEGSAFTVSIPLEPIAPAKSVEPTEKVIIAGRCAPTEHLARMLREHGISVECGSSLKSFKDLLGQTPKARVILMDALSYDWWLGLPELTTEGKDVIVVGVDRTEPATGAGPAPLARCISEPARPSTVMQFLSQNTNTTAPPQQTTGIELPNVDTGDTEPLEVLLAEDNPVNQQVAQALIKRFGHNVTIAENGQIAVGQCKSRRFDLIFMDMQMPIMDGLDAARNIRKLPGYEANPPIIAMTANSSTTDEDACLRAGMNAFLAKPVDRSKLKMLFNQAQASRSH